ncbi:protein transport protein Sec31A-like isoform X2 [Ptychodera flava]|uniref:protein transport protein Sec31A-like isoform X2 n=1 Tax=Ptychodera flava TaxID=63121 RepID=UPI00396A2C24
MKVKEIERTANMAWSPSTQHPIYLAAGTAAQQLDATFSTTAALEIYQLNLSDSDTEMPLVTSLTTEHRFDKLVWSDHGMKDGSLANGILIGGVDNGNIILYDTAKLLNNEDGIITTTDKHTGAVRALDVNPFQSNLLASGGSDSEIFVWDLNNPVTPMTPGAKSQPPDDISCLAWNRQVQHILASTSPGGRSVVWDLRKNEPIIKVTDHSSRIRCKAVAWHPEVATQLVLASEDDHTPVIQMWDLRFATSPLKVLENHQRGVLSVAWCPQDPDLLLSCAKDNRILCWNPNSSVAGGEVVYELPTSSQWCFDVQWCPRNPAVISTSSFDGHISIYSLMGGGQPVQQQQRTDKIAESFPGAETFTSQTPAVETPQEPVLLKKPPKWLRKPVGASFAFGGKLVTFETTKQTAQQQQQQQRIPRQVHISQVVTETDLLKRSTQLEATLQNGNYVDFCDLKISNAKNEFEGKIWNFLKVNFENDSRERFLSLLGYDSRELSKKLTGAIGETVSIANGTDIGVDASELAEKMELLAADGKSLDARLGSGQNTPSIGSKTPDNDAAAAFDVIASHAPVEINTGKKLDSRSQSPFPICTDEDADGLISQSLLSGNFEAAVEICLKSDRLADAIVLAIAGGTHLLAKTQRKYFEKMKTPTSRLISAIVTKDWSDIVNYCELDNWTEALAALMTYSKAEEFSTLCDTLGKRLETEQDGLMRANACLCYVCSGNIDNLVSCWTQFTTNNNSPQELQDLIEKVMILKRSVEIMKGKGVDTTSSGLAGKLSEYSKLLAAQGSLATAMQYLGQSQEQSIAELRDRLYKAQGSAVSHLPEPPFPFKKVSVRDKPEPAVTPTPAQTQTPQQQPGVGVNSFQTTTVSSSQYPASQVATQTRPGQQQQQQQQQQYFNYQDQIANQPAGAYQTTPTASVETSAPNIYSKQGGFGKYPHYPQSTLTQGYGYQTQAVYNQAGGYSSYGQNPPSTGYGATQGGYNTSTTSAASQPYMTTGMGTYGQPGVSSPGAPNMPTQTSTVQNVPMGGGAAPGWNDTPLVRAKKTTSKQPYVPPEPITTPIFGVPQEETPSPPGVNQDAPGAPTPYGQPPQSSQPEPEPPKEKAPIPTEHQVLCDTFDGLTQRCSSAATNPQMKRKLDDVTKRLNALYDKLRENVLSPNVLSGLHEISQAINNYDYQHGLGVHQHIVASGNFSEIGNFMPGLKVLMQVATQLRV